MEKTENKEEKVIELQEGRKYVLCDGLLPRSGYVMVHDADAIQRNNLI